MSQEIKLEALVSVCLRLLCHVTKENAIHTLCMGCQYQVPEMIEYAKHCIAINADHFLSSFTHIEESLKNYPNELNQVKEILFEEKKKNDPSSLLILESVSIPSIVDSMERLWKEKRFTNFTLKIEEKEIAVDKVILSASCPYFQSLFSSNMSEVIKGIFFLFHCVLCAKGSDMKDVLLFQDPLTLLE